MENNVLANTARDLHPQNVEVGRKLQEYREHIGFTQEQMIEAIKSADYFVSVRTYQRYEAGDTTCPAWVFKRVELTFEAAVKLERNANLKRVIGRPFVELLRTKIRNFFG